MAWWSDNRIRMIQNNTRDIDASMDVDAWVKELKSFDCNVAMVGVGGITSFFPTQLEYQCVSPYLPQGRDLIAEILEKCHREGIRVIGRFDFGRTHEKFYEEHKEWYYRSADGHLLRCADTVTTCISSWYQREYSLQIVQEALERYPKMDGIFFNAFGFSGWDYHGHNYGVCHCDNCRRLFREFSGMELPLTDAVEEPAHMQYEAFKRKSIADALERIRALVKGINPEICLCTYSPDGVDMIRNESNSGVGRPYPFPLMNASFNLMASRHSWPDKPMANCVINATDLRWRYAGVSPNLTEIRLYESMASGGCLDFCINGVFSDYPDRGSLKRARSVFQYHSKNERYYGELVSQARVALMRTESGRPIHDGTPDLFGVMKALKEEHILFDLLLDGKVADNPECLSRYSLVIVPDIATVSAAAVSAVRAAGKTLMALAVNAPLSSEMSAALELSITQTEEDNAGAYLATREKEIFRHFHEKDWVFLTDAIGFAAAPGYRPLLPYVKKGEFGPAERAYGYKPTELGSVLTRDGVIAVTWRLGALYHQYGYRDHKYILTDLIDFFTPEARVLHTTAHPCVELFWDASGDCMLLQALNLSGFNGMTEEEPIPMDNVEVEVPFVASQAECLNGGEVAIRSGEHGTIVTIRHLDRFEAVVLR